MVDPWEPEPRRLKLRDMLMLVALASPALAVAAETLRSGRDPLMKSIVAGTAVFVPSAIGLTAVIGRLLFRGGDRRRGDLFLIVYIALTFLSVLAVVIVFMFDKPKAGLLGIALFGFLAYLSSWI